MKRYGIILLLVSLIEVTVLQAEQNSIRLVGSAQPGCWDINEIVAEVTRGAANDREKALALHRFGMAHLIHFDGPIEERGEYVTDPMKLIAVYGYALCGNNSCAMNALYNAAGLKARQRTLPLHAVPEVWFEGKWNYIDTDMFGYVYLEDGQRLASVDELSLNPDHFLKQTHPPDPYFPFDEKKDMAETFRGVDAEKDYHPYSSAHMMNLTLRSGETVRLFFRPQGRGRYFLTPAFRPDLGILYKDYWIEGPVRKGSLAWCDRPPASYGNGFLEYTPDLRSKNFTLENPDLSGVAIRQDKEAPSLVAASPNHRASIVVKVTTPWVISGLQNDLTDFQDNTDAAIVTGLFWRMGPSDENHIFVSRDAGQSWTQVWENHYLGAVPFHVDLTRWVEGEYSYWVKFEWRDRKATGRVGLENLGFKTWLELSPMALPRLAAGRNTFRLSTSPVRCIYSHSRWDRGEGLPGQKLENLVAFEKSPFLRPADPARPGSLLFPIGEGSIEELRISLRVRADKKPQDLKAVLYLSENGGSTWRELERFSAHPEHTMSQMWFNHVVRGAIINGAQGWLKVSISGGGMEQVIANRLVRSVPACSTSLRIRHIWKEGNKTRSAGGILHGRSENTSYTVEAGPGLINEEIQISGESQE